jgi:phosphoglycolate phosphatase
MGPRILPSDVSEDADHQLDLDGFGGVVYDLDGTLVRLVVDWETAAREAVEALESVGVSEADADLWTLLDAADERGHRHVVEEVLVRHERAGAEQSVRLPLAADPPRRQVPLGVCSLNAESAVRLALETHGIASEFGAVVGRDTVPQRKPDPEPLLATLRTLGVDPGDAVFVGDSERDAEAADRAGVAFRYAGCGPSGH